MALVVISEALTSSSNCLLVSGHMRTGAEVTAFLRSRTAWQHSSVHLNGMSLPVS